MTWVNVAADREAHLARGNSDFNGLEMDMAPRHHVIMLCLAAFGAEPALAESPAVGGIKVEAGQKFFEAECRRCHAVDANDPSYGPPLEGVIGRRAGSVDGYPYSEALKAAGIVWTEPALRAWMEDNQGLIPGTKMRHVGISDPVEQAFILAWLRTAASPQ